MLKKIKNITEELTGIEDISVKDRRNNIVYARYLYFALCRYYSDDISYVSLEKIGSVINRAHCTVIHGFKTFDDLMKFNNFPYDELYKIGLKKVLDESNKESPYVNLINKIYKLNLDDLSDIDYLINIKLKHAEQIEQLINK